jgi:hypothetical protein
MAGDEYDALRMRFEQCLRASNSEYRRALALNPGEGDAALEVAIKRASAFAKVTTWQKALAVLSCQQQGTRQTVDG